MKHKTQNTLYHTGHKIWNTRHTLAQCTRNIKHTLAQCTRNMKQKTQSPQCTRVIRRGANGVEHKFYKNTLDENNTLHKCVINESGRTHSKTLETLDENTSLQLHWNMLTLRAKHIWRFRIMIFKTETKTHLLFMIHELSWMHWEERCKKAFIDGLGLEWELQ